LESALIVIETTALGAALQAGLGAGIFSNFSDIKKNWQSDAVFKAQVSQSQRVKLTGRWKKAVEAVKLLSLE
jgi:glycerol kinase